MMIRKSPPFLAPAIIAVLSLAACGGNPTLRPAEPAPAAISAPGAALDEPAAPVTAAPGASADSAAAATPPAQCPPQEAGSGSPTALRSKATSICFTRNKTAPDAGDKPLLQRHAALLKQNRRLVVTLTAFTDHRGSPNYNLAVTGKWLRAVADALADLGVPRHQIRKDAYPRREDPRTCAGPCPPTVPRVELRYRK